MTEKFTTTKVLAPQLSELSMIAIDSALGSSVAVLHGGVIARAVSRDPLGHAENIGFLIERCLEVAGADPQEIEYVVAGVGPGPFTGLRVGIAAAEAFALGVGAEILPVISHDATAIGALTEGAESVRVVQDAKRRELFVTEYAGLTEAGIPNVTAAPHIVARADYVESETDVWPEEIDPADLVKVAALRLRAGSEFPRLEAVYLRQPDVNLIPVASRAE